MKELKNVFRWHPLNGKLALTEKEAERLDQLEETNPSGWVEYTGQDLLQAEQGADGSSNQTESNAVDNNTDQGNPEVRFEEE